MNRIAVIAIMIYDRASAHKVNDLLSEYGQFIIGRMGLPYKEKNVSIISIVVDAPNNIISSLTGKIGKLHDVSVQALYSKEEKK